MKARIFLFIIVAFCCQSAWSMVGPDARIFENGYLYVDEENNVVDEGRRVQVRIVNHYRGFPGCYLACSSNNRSSDSIFFKNEHLLGYVRVEGKYRGAYCNPVFEQPRHFCKDYFPVACENGGCYLSFVNTGIFRLNY